MMRQPPTIPAVTWGHDGPVPEGRGSPWDTYYRGLSEMAEDRWCAVLWLRQITQVGEYAGAKFEVSVSVGFQPALQRDRYEDKPGSGYSFEEHVKFSGTLMRVESVDHAKALAEGAMVQLFETAFSTGVRLGLDYCIHCGALKRIPHAVSLAHYFCVDCTPGAKWERDHGLYEWTVGREKEVLERLQQKAMSYLELYRSFEGTSFVAVLNLLEQGKVIERGDFLALPENTG